MYCRCFLESFLCFPNDYEVCFIKYDALRVSAPFIEIIINVLKASLSLFSVLLLLVLIKFILLLSSFGYAFSTGIIYVVSAIEVIIG